MDSQSALLAALMIAVTISPFALSSYIKRKSNSRLLRSVQDLASESSCKISDYEMCGNYIIGTDDQKKVLFFIQNQGKEVAKSTIVLSKVLQCKKINESRTIKDGSSNYTVVERIALHFIFNERSMPDLQIELYKMENGAKPSGELQSMDRWHSKISSLIKN